MRMKRLAVAVAVALVVSLMAGIVAYAAIQNVTTNVTVGQELALTLDRTSINFGLVTAGSTGKPADNPVVATVQSPSFSYNVALSGTNLAGQTNPSQSIAINNMEYQLSINNGSPTNWAAVPGTSTVVANNQPATTGSGSTYTFSYRLSVPANTPSQSYQGTLTIEATTI
ncbi:hypothetical protein GFC01_02650 [Desulfofundulus thermobenzoicus]|uniref:Spore coat protein U domain-containing protein n=1 Tax=Desulfofundulus thermobenzoicus TaxID=29376 RepID=A0A6N7INJ9_9FIRM|nr:hypothetical protein [Desulfofundulus thermobenzoicus]MQL51179.1 hypothetical protein [Desulfofundulus thermobenzoicus]